MDRSRGFFTLFAGPGAAALVALVALGCGGSAYHYVPASSGGMAVATSGAQRSFDEPPSAPTVQLTSAPEADEERVGGGGWDDFEGEPEEPAPASPEARSEAPPAPPPQRRLARADTTGDPVRQDGGQAVRTATDAVDTSGPLLIYTAELHLAVFEVEQTQDTIVGAVRELGGFLSERSDNHLVLRVPARRFQEAVDQIEEAGEVLQRNIQALDVSEEFRDIDIRIRNAVAMRDRLEALLVRADSVEDALAIERELQRLTDIIERMKGRQRFLADRIAFSTITVRFSSRATETGATDDFRLPFAWLGQLGLGILMTLR